MSAPLLRRTFLKAGTVTVAGIALAKYIEPFETLTKLNDWITDRGDFYIVRVPDFKSFAREELRKPTIFILGREATVRDVTVNGFANVSAPNGGSVLTSVFDCNKMISDRDRSPLTVSGRGIQLNGLSLINTPQSKSAAFTFDGGEHVNKLAINNKVEA